jgi:hypothetical protein
MEKSADIDEMADSVLGCGIARIEWGKGEYHSE